MKVDIIGAIRNFTDMIRICLDNNSFIVQSVDLADCYEMKVKGYYVEPACPEQEGTIEVNIKVKEYGVPLNFRTMKIGSPK